MQDVEEMVTLLPLDHIAQHRVVTVQIADSNTLEALVVMDQVVT